MTTAATINQQIAFVEDQIRHMECQLPKAVADGKLSDAGAAHKLLCANSTLRTLTSLRNLLRGEVANG